LLRSVLPNDLWQLLYLAGTIFLFVSPGLTWVSPPNYSFFPTLDSIYVAQLRLLLFFIVFASLMAYFRCFWSGRKAVITIVLGVLLLGLVGLLWIAHESYGITQPPSSLFQPGITWTATYKWYVGQFWNLPTGFYFCAGGLVLIAFYVMRLWAGVSSLPLSLTASPTSVRNGEEDWPSYKRLIFLLVGPLFLVSSIVRFLALWPFLFKNGIPSDFESVVVRISDRIWVGVIFVLLAYTLAPKARWKAAVSLLRFPGLGMVLAGLFLPILFCFLVGFVPYVFERIHWASFEYGINPPPVLSSYFEFGKSFDPFLLLLVIEAFAEELIFRGLLLPKFLERFGWSRSVLLTGIVWAATHFRTDSYRGDSVAEVLITLAERIVFCVAMNYVLCWMTLRTKSLVPSTIAHTVSNLLVFSGVNLLSWPFGYQFLWCVTAVVLAWYWPIVPAGEAEQSPNGEWEPGEQPA
jgi:membrane protease YdiL (CAAX protease family)